MAIRIPPPPPLARTDPALNRWLIEVASILSAAGGGIDPDQIVGFPELVAEVAALTQDVTDLQTSSENQQTQIGVINTQIGVINTHLSAIDNAITALQARAQVLNGIVAPAAGLGSVSDWYADTVAKHIYVKTGVATWLQIA